MKQEQKFFETLHKVELGDYVSSDNSIGSNESPIQMDLRHQESAL
jgi:hypothetical protein